MPLIRINRQPSRVQLAVFAIAWLVFLGASGFVAWRKGHASSAEVLWALAIAVPVAGAIFPSALRLTFVGLSYATFPIGFVVSHVVLAAVFYLVLAPIGATMRVCGYDPLERRWERAQASYWKLRRDRRAPASYFRQH